MDKPTSNAPDGTPVASLAEQWRNRLGLGQDEATSNLESAGPADLSIDDRLRRARDEMRRVVIDQFGADAALLAGVEALALDGQEAVAVLSDEARPVAPRMLAGLEAVVAFDGSRPSFLVQNGEINLDSSLNTSDWQTILSPSLEALSDFVGCVGRVERGEVHVGSAFLISPTLAMTNRHVAQMISFLTEEGRVVFPDIHLDFGREHEARATFDRRTVTAIVALGAEAITGPIDHNRLDLAILRLSPSNLGGVQKDRFLSLSGTAGDVAPELSVVAAGYPIAWENGVPENPRNEHAAVLARLLGGDAGSKRLSPGLSKGMLTVAGQAHRWTCLHDATTLKGHSGSPMAVLGGGALKARGLHYGGVALGERINWAHVLANCAAGLCLPSGKPLSEVLATEGVGP